MEAFPARSSVAPTPHAVAPGAVLPVQSVLPLTEPDAAAGPAPRLAADPALALALPTAGAPARAPAPVAAPAADAAPLRPASLLAPETLHPALWRADQVGLQRGVVWESGHAELDAALPGGGWPASALTELLLPHAGIGEIRLLAPALAAAQQRGRCVMLFDPPALPFGNALRACGIDLQQLFIVRRRQGERPHGPLPAADVLWALEQALKSGHAGAALAWLPVRLLADTLRRLQLAAQAHAGPVFLLRDDAARFKPSPAPLRLWLRSPRPDILRVQLLKRRGAPLTQALELQLPPVWFNEEIDT